jgi:uncharacterized membrane protein
MISFSTPVALCLLLALPGLWLVALAQPAQRAPLLFASLGLRSLATLALTGALAGAQLLQPDHQLTVIFLLDRSGSVGADQRARAEAYVRQALTSLPTSARAGVVSFGQQASVERWPSDARGLAPLSPALAGGRTNIAAAIQLALGLLPAAGQRRLVLLSDGGANAGDATAATRAAAAADVDLEIVPLDSTPSGLDVQISGVDMPPAARPGEQLRLDVQTSATAATSARLTVSSGGRPVLTRQVAVPAGAGQIEVELPAPASAFERYEVRLTAEDDTTPENDTAEAFSGLRGRASVLFVEGSPGAARNLTDALATASFDTRAVPPDQLPTSMPALSAYDAVVLVDVPLAALPPAGAALLPAYVRNLGRGLAMIGGPHSFGAGGYDGSPIEDLLPVSMRLRPQLELPSVSVVVVIDISGSMTLTENGASKIRLAAEGAARIAAQLRDEDEITVIPFDHQARGTIGPRSGRERDEVARLLASVDAGSSGITMRDALTEAARYLKASDKPVRHLITITDGNDTTQHPGSLGIVRDLNSAGVTISTVAVGGGADVPFLKDVAQFGGGRFFLTERGADLPTIMVDETRLLLRPYLLENPFLPRAGTGADAGPLRGIGALPQLRGYVASTPKSTAQVLLWTPQDDPLLAIWQSGLGRSLAWTSDLKGQWSGDLVRSPAFPTLAAQLIGWLLPTEGSAKLSVATQLDGGQLKLTARAQDEAGNPASGLRLSGELIDAAGRTRAVALREATPGSYTAAVDDAPDGTYQIRVVAARPDGQPFATAGGGAVIPRGSEYRAAAGGQQLLESMARIGGGRIGPAPEAVFSPTNRSRAAPRDLAGALLWLALGLLPLEVALRRLPRRDRARRPRSDMGP